MTHRGDSSRRLQQAGLLTAIPIVLLVGPAVGYYVGSAIDQRWPAAPWGMMGGIVLGLAASVRVTVQLIKRSSEIDRNG